MTKIPRVSYRGNWGFTGLLSIVILIFKTQIIDPPRSSSSILANMLNKAYNSHNYPLYISDNSIEYHTILLRMNLIKKRITLPEMEVGDYVFLPWKKTKTWNMVLEQNAKFPDVAKLFIRHAEIRIPKFAIFPYFCYETLELKKDSAYFVVKKADMIDIVENNAKSTLALHDARVKMAKLEKQYYGRGRYSRDYFE